MATPNRQSSFPAPPPPPPSNLNPAPSPMLLNPNEPQGPVAARGTMVDVRICCRGISLPGGRGLLPSSFAVIYSRTPGKSDWQETLRSETVADSSSPDYHRIFQMEYRFELYQELQIVIFHRTDQSENLQIHTLLGVATCTLGSIISCHGRSLELPLQNNEAQFQSSSFGTVVVQAEEILSAKKMVSMTLAVAGLMTPQQIHFQKEHINSLHRKVEEIPEARTSLQKRGAAALISRFKRGGGPKENVVAPGALPAHMANEIAQQEQKRQEIKQEIKQVEQQYEAPPPFVPFVTILIAPKEASAAIDIRSPDIEWAEVYKSLEIDDYEELRDGFTLQPITLSEYELCEGDENRYLKLAIIQSRPGEQDAILGEYITTFPALRSTCVNQEQAVLNLQPIGTLSITNYSERVEPSFIDYLRGGWCDFALMTAIDFTSSNGDPRQHTSKHYLPSPGHYQQVPPNEYEAAMRTVGNMLGSYSTDKRILAFGFGAYIAPNTPVSHCFPIIENGKPYCSDVNGLVNSYKDTLGRIQLHGPTMFSEILRMVGNTVTRRLEVSLKSGNNHLAYTVLLILTDGAISDYDRSLEQLLMLSRLPLSIIIIGIGDEDFGRMRTFDVSNGPLKRGTQVAAREFVQFVPYNEFKGDLSQLAEKVLGGIPDQVVSYIEKIRGGVAPPR